ncbi:MAG TPA: chemotaxis protein CheB [Bryobacteraceae bacterium]|nr:chemotaxis protein CheB [Bryobacteraceae bacterium]
MAEHDIFVIGASAGGVEALQELTSQLPSSFPGSLLVVMHLLPRTRSFLPEILGRSGSLPAEQATDGGRLQHGHIYVAPPDHHLLVERDHMHLNRGPKEQHHRPCINVTLRSAALAYSERVTGILLTGELDDGTAGLWEVKRRGGIAIVQNPESAPFPSMPLSALREVEADYIVDVSEMGALLMRLANGQEGRRSVPMEVAMEERRLTDLTCPDCRGTIWEVWRGKNREYRCRVGHTYSPKAMFAEHFAAQEKALYAAMVALEEGASLANRLADNFELPENEHLRAEAQEREKQAALIRKILEERSSFSLD